MDLNDLLDSWLISLRAEGKSKNTIRAYSAAARKYLADHDTLDRNQFRAWLADIGHPSTRNLYCRSVQQFSKWLAAEGEIETDPLAGIKPPKPADKMVESLSEDEITAMRTACKGGDFRSRRDLALLEFGISTGIRAEEMLSLRTDDVDMKQMVAIIRRGKGGKPRVVPFSYVAAKALDRYLRMRRKHPYAASEWLWLSERSTLNSPLSYTGLFYALRQRAAQAGVRGFSPHRMRHTMASSWLRSGGSEGGLASVAGWSDPRMIGRYVQDQRAQLALAEARKIQGT